ncbi:MAG: 50S ribosomal protein L32 [Planctomycetes bacterium]|nr:50S ribosomal protein L32 [Planctomycetota bacterium]
MAHPKRRTSKARKNKRRSHLALNPVSYIECPECGKPKRSHRVCSSCGAYDKDRKVAI